jgi:signal transduction histidine kinase
MAHERGLSIQAVLDGLGQGALIFDSANHLVYHNQAAQLLLGNDLRAIQSLGWSGAVVLFDRQLSSTDATLDDLRHQALTAERPGRFHIQRDGEIVPCWAAVVHGDNGELYTLISIEAPDWLMLGDMWRRYLREVEEASEAVDGHAVLIEKSLQNPKANQNIEQVTRRIGGFAQIIRVQIYRLRALTALTTRMEAIQTGSLADLIAADLRKVNLLDFLEDFIETLDETPLVDPETDTDGHRGRIKLIVPTHLTIFASTHYLALVLRDLLRNAIMYSMRGTAVRIVAYAGSKENSIQIDVSDEGYGIRATEYERVFAAFQRARQPQIISEFGYGLSLYLCKHEVEAMNGQLWFESQEGSGSTFSIRLPAWR